MSTLGDKPTPDEYADLLDLMETLEPQAKLMNDASREFLDQMIERHEKYGEDIFVSPRQWKWLRSLRDQFGN